jgi:hypothetical protein
VSHRNFKKKDSPSPGESVAKSEEPSPSCHSSSFIPATPALHSNLESNQTLSAFGPKSKRRIVTSTPKTSNPTDSSTTNLSNAKQSLIAEESSDESLDEWSRNLLSRTRDEINQVKKANKLALSKERNRLPKPSKGKSIEKKRGVDLKLNTDSASKKKSHYIKHVEDSHCSDVSKNVPILNATSISPLDQDSNFCLEACEDGTIKSVKKKNIQAQQGKRNPNLATKLVSTSFSLKRDSQVLDNQVFFFNVVLVFE